MQPLIHLEKVNKVFTTDEVETHALAGIHLDIERGEFVSIAGPSGCGKSTLLAILGLLDSPTEGPVHSERQDSREPESFGAGEDTQSRNRIYFPGI